MTAFVPRPTAHVQHSAEQQVLHDSELRLQLPVISWIMGRSACAVGQTYRKKRQVGDKKNNPRVISKSKFHKVRASSSTNSKNILLFYLHLIRKTNYTVLSLLLRLNKIVGAFTSTWSQMSANKLWFDFLTSKVKKWTVTRILIFMGNMYMCKNKRTLKKELYVSRLHWCPNVVGEVFILRDKPGAFCPFPCVVIWCLDNHM